MLVSGYLFSRITRRIIHWGKPISISFEPTNRCNLHCPECPSGTFRLTRKRGIADFEIFRKTIDQLSPQLFYLTLYFQGEPFLSNEFFRMIKYARDKNIYIASSTNGHFLTAANAEETVKSGLNKIIISVDGTDQKTYETYRKDGNFQKVISGIKELVKAKKDARSGLPYIEMQFIVFRHNEHQINDIKQLGKELGVDKVSLKTAQVYNFGEGGDLIPLNDKYSRYRRIEINGKGNFVIKSKLPDHCWRMWSSPVVTWDGNVVPCCYDKDADFRMGNIAEKSFAEIWKSSEYNAFRKSIFTGRKNIGICSNCDQKF